MNIGKIGPIDIFGKVATQVLGISAYCKSSPYNFTKLKLNGPMILY